MTVFIRHEIWAMDPPRDYPVVTHEFRGATREEAYEAYLTHYAGDAFLRSCADHDQYALPSGQVVRCRVKWWYDDDDARTERIARAWIEARRPASAPTATSTRGAALQPDDVPPADGGPPPGFRPRVIQGGGVRASVRPPGHEDHDPNVCDVRTG